MPIRSGALLQVHYDPVRSVVIGYEFALNYCPDYDMGDHDLATIGSNRHISKIKLYRKSIIASVVVGNLISFSKAEQVSSH